MTDADILFEAQGGWGVVTLNRPKALNALTRDMCAAFLDQLTAWRGDEGVKAVLVRGAGDRAFCAGGDILAIREAGMRGEVAPRRDFFATEYRLNTAIHEFPKPYVALIDGIVMGGGVGVSVHGSHRVATERSLFAMPETGIGFFPDVGGTWFLSRLPRRLGLYLALVGARLKAADLVWSGLCQAHVPSARMGELQAALLAEPAAIDAVIARFHQPAGPAPLAAVAEAIDRFFQGPSVAAILAALEADSSDFARQTAAALRGMSPLSLAVTFRQISDGAGLDFREAMRRELRLAVHATAHADFIEGVRAQIVDKDRQPRWTHASVEAVTAAEVAALFASLGADDLAFD